MSSAEGAAAAAAASAAPATSGASAAACAGSSSSSMATTTTGTVLRPGLAWGQVAIVSGGGTGIGLATARQLVALGARVAICGRRAHVLRAAAAELRAVAAAATEDEADDAAAAAGGGGGGAGGGAEKKLEAGEGGEQQEDESRVLWRTCDIRDVESCRAFVGDVVAAWERVDMLANVAGGQFPIQSEFLSSKGFNAVVRNNLLGSFNMTSAVAKMAMIPQGLAEKEGGAVGTPPSSPHATGGRVVTVIAQIKRGFPGMAATGAARAGVENLTMSLAVEWARFGIKLNTVAPGVIVTPGTDNYETSAIERARQVAPLKRTAEPEETANLINFLLLEAASSFITGACYYQDGGQSLAGDFWIAGQHGEDSVEDIRRAKF